MTVTLTEVIQILPLLQDGRFCFCKVAVPDSNSYHKGEREKDIIQALVICINARKS
jgi:hypothetical protein